MLVIFLLSVPLIASGSVSEQKEFTFDIVGTKSNWILVGYPFSPNYTDPPPADAQGYKTLAIRLSYEGETRCKVIGIILWQAILENGVRWNRTQHTAPLPSKSLSPGATFIFLLEVESSYDAFVLSGWIFLKIDIEEFGEITLSSKMPDPLLRLESWPLSSISSPSTIDISWNESLGVIFLTLIILVFRRKARKTY
jgi:hypothetical protein